MKFWNLIKDVRCNLYIYLMLLHTWPSLGSLCLKCLKLVWIKLIISVSIYNTIVIIIIIIIVVVKLAVPKLKIRYE